MECNAGTGGMPAKELPTGIITANLQGINRKGDEMDHTKWDQLTQVIETTHATVILVQETWGAEGAQAHRNVPGYWSVRAEINKRGHCAEVWCRASWGKKVAVLQDTTHALSVLIQTDMGVGVATSCHMPQRAEESEYEAQAIVIEEAHALMHTKWSIWGGGGMEQGHPMACPHPQDSQKVGSTSTAYGQHDPPTQGLCGDEGSPMHPRGTMAAPYSRPSRGVGGSDRGAKAQGQAST